MAIKKGVYKYNTGEKDENGNIVFDDVYFKTFASLVEDDENNRFTSDKEKLTWNGKASTDVVTQTTNGLMSTADKKKLDGVESGANAYVHPLNHQASMILVDDTHQFVTTNEKGTWNGKASTAAVTQTANGLMSAADKKKLDGVESGANAYVHPTSHKATMIEEDTNHRFATDAEKETWNGKANNVAVTQTVNGLMIAADKKKLDGVQAGANAYVHPSSHGASMIDQDATHRFTTDQEKEIWNSAINYRKKYASGTTLFAEYSIDTVNKDMLKWNVSIVNKENQRGFYLAVNNVDNGNFISVTSVGGTVQFELTLIRGDSNCWVVHWSGNASVGGQFEHCGVINSAEITNLAVHTGGYGDQMINVRSVMTLV